MHRDVETESIPLLKEGSVDGVCGVVNRSSSAYDQIYDKICTAGVQGAKAYFSATVSASGHLAVDVGNVLPVQPW